MDATPQKTVTARAMGVGIAQVTLWMVLCSVVLSVAPHIEKILKDFNCTLSEPTMLAIKLCHFVFEFWYLAILPICLWPIANRGVVSALWPNPENVVARRLWYAATWLLPVVVAAFLLIALLLPLMALYTRLSEPPSA